MTMRSPVATAAVLVAVAVAATDTGGGLRYEVVAVSGKLLRVEPAPEVRLEPGAVASPGEVLRTGWRSSAELEVPERGARFSLRPRTTVRLAADSPGVLLEVERGMLRAVFAAAAGEEAAERVVTTPSAVLAVRGTEYGVEVSSGGDTTVVVFEGVVEVRDLARQGPPVSVAAGQVSTVRRGKLPGPPKAHRLSPRDWDRGKVPVLAGDRRGAPRASPSSMPSSPGPGDPGRRPGGGGSGRGPG